MTVKTGIFALGRSTFDLELAKQNHEEMRNIFNQLGWKLHGPNNLLLEPEDVSRVINQLNSLDLDQIFVLQVTFTDASSVIEIAESFDLPLTIWAVPEPRLGGRLRLNSFCGLNLAAHSLGLRDIPFSWLFRSPGEVDFDRDIEQSLNFEAREKVRFATDGELDVGSDILNSLENSKICRIGEHPPGFDTCKYDENELKSLAGIKVDVIGLQSLFDKATHAETGSVSKLKEKAATNLDNLDDLNTAQLDQSLRLKVALEQIKLSENYDAFAIRCWPETFTEFGGAVCGPVSMMGEKRVPCACEADVYGAVSQLLMQHIADDPVFLVDVVDMDIADDTGVVWHCGQAPLSMKDPEFTPRGTVHTNRKMPLLYEFPLKPGIVTLARISQARGRLNLTVARGEILKRPMAFTGTSGVIQFVRPLKNVLADLVNSTLEHHMVLAYGDHQKKLESFAKAAELPILQLS